MKITVLRGTRDVLDEIAVGIAGPDARAVAIERIDKHAYRCRIGRDEFLFRSARARHEERLHGPGIELRHTTAGAAPVDIEEVPGSPGVVRSLRFERPVHLHIETDGQALVLVRHRGA